MTKEERVCEHGLKLRGSPDWSGGWNGGVSECSCCFSVFGYIDSGSCGTTGGYTRSWQPKNRCHGCGGKYEEHNWGNVT